MTFFTVTYSFALCHIHAVLPSISALAVGISCWWFSVRLWSSLHCWCTGDTTVLHFVNNVCNVVNTHNALFLVHLPSFCREVGEVPVLTNVPLQVVNSFFKWNSTVYKWSRRWLCAIYHILKCPGCFVCLSVMWSVWDRFWNVQTKAVTSNWGPWCIHRFPQLQISSVCLVCFMA